MRPPTWPPLIQPLEFGGFFVPAVVGAFASMSYYVAVGRRFRHAHEMGERVFLVAAIAIGIIVPMVGALYAAWMLMH